MAGARYSITDVSVNPACASPPSVRRDEIIGGQVVDAGVAQPGDGGVETAAQDVRDVLHPGLPVGGQAPRYAR